MRRPWLLMATWGVWFAVVTAVQLAFSPPLIQIGVPAAAVACILAFAGVVWGLDRRAGGREAARAINDGSVATATLVAGVALALLGAGFGLWLVLIGAGVIALGLGGLVREGLGRRRALRTVAAARRATAPARPTAAGGHEDGGRGGPR